jgi:hypothetical protein
MKALHYFIILLSFGLITSCGGDDTLSESEQSILIEKENTLTAQEKIRELLLITKGNYGQLACILNCSPSTLKRLKDGETFATPEAEVEINKHYNYFIVKKNSLENFKADCASYKWYNHVKSFMSNWWFWLAVILILVVYGSQTHIEKSGVWFPVEKEYSNAGASVGIFFGVLFIYGIIWIINYFGGQPDFSNIPDNFINTMDTVWETKI